MTLATVRLMLTDERLQPYLDASQQDLAFALQLYRWNQDVSAMLLPVLGDLEITLRNALCRQLSAMSGDDPWWKHPGLIQDRKTATKLDGAQRRIVGRGKTVTDGRMISELSLGFWVALIGTTYDQTLWRQGLHLAFPAYRGRRRDLHQRFQYVLELRNKISHHERIWHRDLVADFRTIRELIGLLSVEMNGWARHYERVEIVLRQRPSPNSEVRVA